MIRGFISRNVAYPGKRDPLKSLAHIGRKLQCVRKGRAVSGITVCWATTAMDFLESLFSVTLYMRDLLASLGPVMFPGPRRRGS